ncbi:hypothetical protein, partial [Streptomyces rimosus]
AAVGGQGQQPTGGGVSVLCGCQELSGSCDGQIDLRCGLLLDHVDEVGGLSRALVRSAVSRARWRRRAARRPGRGGVTDP